MSVTFIAETQDGFATKSEPCPCAQMSEHFSAFVLGERTDWEALRPDASANCQVCQGTGVEEVRVDLRPQANFANGNARIIMVAMGWNVGEYLHGECDLAELRRGVIRARNVTHPETLRECEERKGYIGYGYTREDLMRAIDELDHVAITGEGRGAKKVSWG